MFKKLREHDKSFSQLQKSKPTYTQKSQMKIRQNNSSYSNLHKNRKCSPNYDYELVCNDSYLFQGQWQKSQKNGQGIALLKNGTMIIGTWYKGRLNGRSLIFTSYGALVSANFINDKLNGWMIALYGNKLVICNLFFEDRVDGPRIVFESSEGVWIASNFTQKGQFVEITNVQKGSIHKLPIFLQNDELTDLYQELVLQKDYSLNFQRIKTMQISTKTKYIGFTHINPHTHENIPCGLGVTYSQSECFVGYFQNGILQQFGRMIFANGDIYQGGINGGSFNGHGIYFNSHKNVTSIIVSYSDNDADVLETQEGYYLVDFQIKLGHRLNKQDSVCVSNGLKTFLKALQKYYYQYFIQVGIRDGQGFSNISIKQQEKVEEDRLREIDEKGKNFDIRPELDRVGSLTKWMAEDHGLSEEGNSFNQEEENQAQKSNLLETKKSDDVMQKNRKNQYMSIALKENQDPEQREKHEKHVPHQINYKKKLFISDAEGSKSLDINQLTFRGANDQPDSPKIRKNSAFQNNSSQNQYFEQSQRENKFSDRSEVESSEISNMQQKIKGMMKKSNLRKRIFQ